jgi:hypothetical protein
MIESIPFRWAANYYQYLAGYFWQGFYAFVLEISRWKQPSSRQRFSKSLVPALCLL